MVIYLGNEIKLASGNLSHCLFESNWTKQTHSCKKCITILKERLKRPQELIVGKLYPLNLLTFTSVSQCQFCTMSRERVKFQKNEVYARATVTRVYKFVILSSSCIHTFKCEITYLSRMLLPSKLLTNSYQSQSSYFKRREPRNRHIYLLVLHERP